MTPVHFGALLKTCHPDPAQHGEIGESGRRELLRTAEIPLMVRQ
jgi:hypothetical protein